MMNDYSQYSKHRDRCVIFCFRLFSFDDFLVSATVHVHQGYSVQEAEKTWGLPYQCTTS